jgi:hypothetical protein
LKFTEVLAATLNTYTDDARTQLENLKSDLIESQRSEIKPQKNLLEVQAEQPKSVSTVVDTALLRKE